MIIHSITDEKMVLREVKNLLSGTEHMESLRFELRSSKPQTLCPLSVHK